MDPTTRAALTFFKPSLSHALQLLREGEAAKADVRLRDEKILAAHCELEQVLDLSKDLATAAELQRQTEQLLADVAADEAVKGDRHERHAQELQHLLSKSRMYAQRVALKVREAQGRSFSEAQGALLKQAEQDAERIDRMARTGLCGCEYGCDFAALRKPLRVAAIVVKPALRVVPREEKKP